MQIMSIRFHLSYLIILSFNLASYSQQKKDLPKIVNWGPEMTEVKNQGDRAACASFATIGLVEYAIKKKYGIELNLSEQYLNYLSLRYSDKKTECTDLHECLEKVKDVGVLLEQDWPYQPSYFRKGYPCDKYNIGDSNSPTVCYSHKGPSIEVQTRLLMPNLSIRVQHPTNIAKVKKLLDHNYPFIFSFPLSGYNAKYDSAKLELTSTYIDEFKLASKSKKKLDAFYDRTDLHFAIICGYNEEKSLFYIRNSWGKGWGNGGIGTISFSELSKYFELVTGFATAYYVKLIDTTGLNIPIVKNVRKIEVTEVTSYPVINKDSTLTLNIQGIIKNLGFRNLEIRSVLVASRTIDGKEVREEMKLSKQEDLLLNDSYARKVWVHSPDSTFKEDLVWSKSNPLKLVFPKEMLLCQKVKEALKDKTTTIILQTRFLTSNDIKENESLLRLDHILDLNSIVKSNGN